MRFLKIDLTLQKILGVIYLMSGFLGIGINGLLLIALITQLLLGGWQVLSALILVISNQDKKRAYYLALVVFYFVIITWVTHLTTQDIIPETIILPLIGLLFIPLGFAIWYFRLTLQDYKQLLKTPDRKQLNIEMEDILDSEELGLR